MTLSNEHHYIIEHMLHDPFNDHNVCDYMYSHYNVEPSMRCKKYMYRYTGKFVKSCVFNS